VSDLIQADQKLFVAEWIRASQRRGFVATPRVIVPLLDYANTNPALRHAVSDVAGERGRWIARRSGKWPWLNRSTAAVIDESHWVSGELPERLSWLQQKLEQDPQLAAESIDTSWPGDSPDTREAFVTLVSRYPHSAHESWLQQRALNDRRQNIRHAAVRTLMQLPESGFRKRSLERASSVLSKQKKRLKKTMVGCTPPASFEPDWALDGIKEKPPGGTGSKAFWMQQIVAMIPLQDWSLMLDDQNPLALKLDPDWSDTIIDGWCQAALLHPDVESLAPLLQRVTGDVTHSATWGLGSTSAPASEESRLKLSRLTELLKTLQPEELADLLEPLKIQKPLLLELTRRYRPFVSSSGHKVLYETLTDWLFTTDGLTRPEAIALSSCFEPAAIPSLLNRISKLDELSSAMEEFARALEQRQNYLKHFSEDPLI